MKKTSLYLCNKTNGLYYLPSAVISLFRLLKSSPFLLLTVILPLISHAQTAPTGLMTQLLSHPENTTIGSKRPVFSWVVPTTQQGDYQRAFQILIATGKEKLANQNADIWNTGKIVSRQSINVHYSGKPLTPNTTYFWQVRTWNRQNCPSDYSIPQKFITSGNLSSFEIPDEPVIDTPAAPIRVVQKKSGTYFIDFGKDAFGWLRLTINSPSAVMLLIRLGEKSIGDSVDRHPGGHIRYADTSLAVIPGEHTYDIHTSPDYRNTHGYAVPVPDHLGVLLPFRYAEIEKIPAKTTQLRFRQIRVHAPINNKESYFHSSDSTLNAVWNLCKYSIKATTALGLYIDGDRERRPYEADAYIDQLGTYAISRNYSMARLTSQYLLKHPTWPTEWKFHSIFIAYADYMYTGNKELLQKDYQILQSKLLQKYARPDGLLDTHLLQDNVDWPKGERDGFVMKPVNTVVNAFYYRSLIEMSDIAHVLGKRKDAVRYLQQAMQLKKVYNNKLFNTQTGLYVDGIGTLHSSDHANFFPLAFGLVPASRQADIIKFLVSRGMACSVYGAQYLLTALYRAGAGNEALHLLTSHDKRSWYNMIRVGSTITMEAWDKQFKSNLDWNHAWGAAPANIIPRYLMGIRPLSAGFSKVLISPQPGSIQKASAKFPTIRGPIYVRFNNQPDSYFKLSFTIPANMTVRVGVPDLGNPSDKLRLNGHFVNGLHTRHRVYLDLPAGHYAIERIAGNK